MDCVNLFQGNLNINYPKIEVFMSVIDLILLLIIAGLCGAIGQAITGFSRGGCLVSIAVGFIGALIGGWIAREMNLPELFVVEAGDFAFPIVWSIIGSALFVAIVSLISRGR
jgi:uncharacterized membrane protein YeaQ/YmgE (transglycosylase-associated protein family)